MRLKVSKSKNASSLYVIKDINVEGKRTTKIVESLGTYDELIVKLNGQDPYAWAKDYINELNKLEKNKKLPIIIKGDPNKQIVKDRINSFNGGYLFLQSIYHQLKLDNICKTISSNYKFDYDLNSILSRLIYSRMLSPSSKIASFDYSKSFLEGVNFELHDVYRSLEVLADNSEFIQEQLYKNSLNVVKRNTKILYYDCTNYFFEINEPDGLKQFGISKEHRPNPIVQMGLFMDGNGIPLAFNINSGNTNEQVTLKPLEKKIIKDFGLSQFVVCTDAGLASNDNRRFNDIGNRAFITTQSIKKLKKHLKEWSLGVDGWQVQGSDEVYNLDDVEALIDECEDSKEITRLSNLVFYKSRWINENDLEQKLVITFSFKHRNYQRNIRNKQIERAAKKIIKAPSRIGKINQNDYRRFIKATNTTKDGEIANKKSYDIDYEQVEKEIIFDGFYGVCTNLESDTSEIVAINKQRWQVEECFRIMKSEFKARPVYLQKDKSIEAHFLTCFISLLIYRVLEQKLEHKHTCHEILDTLSNIKFTEIRGEGYSPAYTRTDLTDLLHEKFGFRTDYEIVTVKKMKENYKFTKKYAK